MKKNELDTALLVAAVRCDDDLAFERLAEEYSPLLGSLFIKYSATVPSCDTEEVRQYALTALYRAARTYDPSRGAGFGTYAKHCIENALISEFVRKRPGHSTCSLDDIGETEQSASGREDVSERVINRETVDRIFDGMDSALSTFERQALLLHIEGLSASEIASRLHRSAKSVSNAVSRAVTKLHCLLKL